MRDIMRYNIKKLRELISGAKYISTTNNTNNNLNISPVWTVERSDWVWWGKSNEIYKHIPLFSFNEYDLSLDRKKFTSTDHDSLLPAESMIFYYINPIEISRPFDTVKDIMNLFCNNTTVLEKCEYCGSSKPEIGRFIAKDYHLSFPSKTSFKNIITSQYDVEMDIRRFFNNQVSIENNTVYLLNNSTWIKFWELFPISFEEAII